MLLFKKEGSIAYITLNRPEKYNSVNQALAFEIQSAFDDCAADKNIRAIVLSGTGKAFCAGQDLGEIVDPNGPPLNDIVSKHYNPIVMQIRDIEVPVIAAVNGVAAGAGANIALACDVVIAKESASFLQAFSKIGLIPDSGGTYTLPRLIGQARASALMMLGEKVPAKEAMEMGMIYKAVNDEEYDAYVDKIANKLANMPTKGLAYTKKLLNLSAKNNMEEQLAMEHEYQSIAGATADYKEGVNAFLEKRKPVFKGE
ncbi:MAG: enoyl-CoA hydratase-related protein [Saprospiraceae bacterium]|nr:enoyl-CoA hydratase-related protein [Saprospiraceae bacterium]